MWLTNGIEPEQSRISEINGCRDARAMSNKQAHNNVAYKWNRTEPSPISKINRRRDERAMSI